MVSALHISSQLAYLRVRGIYPHFQQASGRYNIPVALLLAIASRESNMGLALMRTGRATTATALASCRSTGDTTRSLPVIMRAATTQANITYGAHFLAGVDPPVRW